MYASRLFGRSRLLGVAVLGVLTVLQLVLQIDVASASYDESDRRLKRDIRPL